MDYSGGQNRGQNGGYGGANGRGNMGMETGGMGNFRGNGPDMGGSRPQVRFGGAQVMNGGGGMGPVESQYMGYPGDTGSSGQQYNGMQGYGQNGMGGMRDGQFNPSGSPATRPVSTGSTAFGASHSGDPNSFGKVGGYHSTTQKFTGNMHPDSSIFKNLPNNQNSLASQGILRKDPSRMHKESLGMNPNVRVEDEYIDNLMKQIHFMNLEIGLLKQKQDENKDVMGIRGLMSKDKTGYVDHIIEANSKFLDLLKGMSKEKIVLEDQMLRCKERQQKLIHLRDLHQKRHEKSGKDYRTEEDRLRQQMKELRDKLQGDRDFRTEMQSQIDKVAKSVQESKSKNEELTKYVSEKDLFDRIQKEVEDDEDRILLEQLSVKDELIESYIQVRDGLQDVLDKDKRLSDLKELNENLQKQLQVKQDEASDTDYKVMEIEARQQLAVKTKDKEAQDRKNLQSELETLKDLLDEEIRKNNDRVQKKLRESSFEELGKRDIILRKAQEELNSLRVQYDRIHKEFKNFKLDHLRKTTYLDKLRKENELKEKELQGYENTIKDTQPKVDEFKAKVEDLDEKIKDMQTNEEVLRSTIEKLEERHADLSARVNWIKENFDLEGLMKGINLEELKRVMDSNLQFNSTITELLNRWDGMRKLGREPTSNLSA